MALPKSRRILRLLTPPEERAPQRPRRVSSQSLLGSAREVVIDHGGETYRLRHTSNGWLILTK